MADIDHVVAGAIVLVSVTQAFADPEVFKKAPRMTFFKAGAVTGLMMGGLVLVAWSVAGRPIEDFGLSGWIGRGLVPAALAAAVWALVLVFAASLVMGRFRGAVTHYFSGYAHLMPHSRGELPAAYATASLAGFGEEIAYRGFLLWYFEAFAGLGVAALASSVIFGLAHGYQGKLSMAYASLAGLFLAGTYMLTGSLLLVLFMHASYNIASFTVGYRLLHAPASGVDRSDAPFHS